MSFLYADFVCLIHEKLLKHLDSFIFILGVTNALLHGAISIFARTNQQTFKERQQKMVAGLPQQWNSVLEAL